MLSCEKSAENRDDTIWDRSTLYGMKCAFLNGLGTAETPHNALVCYQKAEIYLYDMVARGEWMYKKSWQAAISGQAQAREKLAKLLAK